MANKIDYFWELFNAVAGGTGEGVTDVQDSLAKGDRTKIETYFTEVIDQISFSTADYNRLRKFLVDLFATHRTLSTQSISATDPHSLTNSDLDELFRSFGYPHSSQLRGFDENPLEQKVQFFLDLVNLYKVKGTPQSLVDVLQYYGVTEVDIYEFLLKLDAPGSLIFDGKAVAGTSVTPNTLQVPFANLTSTDPHWMYTAQQILTLNEQLKINLPSQTPYLGVQPIVDLDGAEFSLIARYVQDQYASWVATGDIPPPNAEITFIGEVKSLLELYLSTIYMFNKLFEAGADSDNGFMCYDGTSTDSIEIIDEFNTITDPPFRRCDFNDLQPPLPVDATSGIIIPSSYCSDSKLSEFYDVFTRPVSSNFLINKDSAGDVLAMINPTLKDELDSAGEPLAVLYSLLKDLANWVRTNIGLGFVNFGFILFGINEFFKDLKPVIEFFKPYRARLLLIEALQIRNRLFNTIMVEDSMSFDFELEYHDFLTGNSTPCCVPSAEIDSTTAICINDERTACHREFVIAPEPDIEWKSYWRPEFEYSVNDVVVSGIDADHYICIQSHTSSSGSTKPGFGSNWTLFWNLYSQLVCVDSTSSDFGVSVHSRDFYDCGSYHDIGAVTDISKDLFVHVDQYAHDHLRCPADGTGAVTSELFGYDTTSTYDTTSALSPHVVMKDLATTEDFEFYQSGGFRNFDDEGSFDCTHGFDLVKILIDTEVNYLLQENGDYLLQENGDRIII